MRIWVIWIKCNQWVTACLSWDKLLYSLFSLLGCRFFSTFHGKVMWGIIDASRPCAWFLKALQMATVSEMTGWCVWLRFISFYLLHHAAPSGRSAISVSHLYKQASAHVYTCVLIKQPCAHKVRAQHTCMHAVDKRAGEHSDYLCTVKTVAGGAVWGRDGW